MQGGEQHCRVFLQGSEARFGSCILQSLRARNSCTGGPTSGTRHSTPSNTVHVTESSGGIVNLCVHTIEGAEAATLSNSLPLTVEASGSLQHILPLGHSSGCPAAAQPGLESSHPYAWVILSVVTLIQDESTGRILLTRRHPGLRAFPSAWVLPGGHVDEGELTGAAATREVWEETGLTVDSLTPLCLWESCYPTRAHVGPIRRHHLMVVYKAQITDPGFLRLQEDEADKAVWLDPTEVHLLLQASSESLRADTVRSAEGDLVSLAALQGIYPNAEGQGIAEGHVFALRTWLQEQGKM